jgi:hypothetical protein
MRHFLRWFTPSMLLVPVLASATCVTTSAELDAALKAWQTSSATLVTIKIHQGTYSVSGDYSQYEGGSAALNLLGGYYAKSSDPCGNRQMNAQNTILQGDGTYKTAFGLDTYGSNVRVEGITVRNYGNVNFFATSGQHDIANSIFTGNGYAASTVSAVMVDAGSGGESIVENSLFYGNHSYGALQLGVGVPDENTGNVVLINDTVANNDYEGLRVSFSASETTDLSIVGYNNILYGNGGKDLDTLASTNTPALLYSDIGSWVGTFSTDATLLLNSDPKFVNPSAVPFGDFTLQNTSPAINVGAPAYDTEYATTDLGGGTRLIGSAIDLGAYESIVDDLIPQYVTSTSDGTGAGTLRAALAVANSNPNATTIRFNISGGCPQVIALATPLADVVTDITIDGYSQPGAAFNSQSDGYDGTICIILRASGSVDHALQTGGAGRLSVQGIEFEGFSTAAVRLPVGSKNKVVGSGFAAMTGAPPNANGVRIEGSATNSYIGEDTPSQHNVFDQSTHAAIDIESAGAGHNVYGNFIGFNFDGSIWSGAANKYGIYVAGTANNAIEYNAIGGTVDSALVLTGANASGNVIVYNVIGSTPFDGAAAGNGAGVCTPICLSVPAIDIVSSAHDNYIGALGGSGGGNLVTNNYGSGVAVETGAGNGNRIYGNNLIHDNGGNLPIDLGSFGPTLNDVGDTDTGPNKLQNYPTLSQAMRIEANVVRISGSLVAQTGVPAGGYRLDVFWTDSCLYSGGGTDTPRGDMKRYVGFFNIFSDGSTFNVPYSTEDVIASIDIPSPGPATPGYLFAIATDGNGNTSEPGPCHAFIDDYIFGNGFN